MNHLFCKNEDQFECPERMTKSSRCGGPHWPYISEKEAVNHWGKMTSYNNHNCWHSLINKTEFEEDSTVSLWLPHMFVNTHMLTVSINVLTYMRKCITHTHIYTQRQLKRWAILIALTSLVYLVTLYFEGITISLG